MSAVARARRPPSPAFLDPPGYARHRPERTLLYQLVEQHYPAFRELPAAADRPLPDFVQQEFEAYLKCGRLEEGFLRVRCEQCHAEKLVAFSCKKRGFCPSCGGRRMAETAALLADEVLPTLVPKPRMHLTRARRVCPAQSVWVGGDAGAAGPGCSEAAGVWRGSDQARDAASCGDELGATAEASVRHRDRELRALRWPAEDHRQHRGAAVDCEDPVAPEAGSAGAESERAAA
jgi:ribosomal protein S27E